MRWNRLSAMICMAAFGIGGAWSILSINDAPRWAIALSGVMGLAGAFAALVLAAFLVSVVVEDVRPTIRIRRPAVPLALAHREASMVGRRRYRMHPITFWGVLTLNNRFVFGFMVFSDPEYIDYADHE